MYVMDMDIVVRADRWQKVFFGFGTCAMEDEKSLTSRIEFKAITWIIR